MDANASKALEAMLREHNENSIIFESFLSHIKSRYHISIEYNLHVSTIAQWPFDPFLNGFGLSVDVLEVGLRLPLHSLVVSWLRQWKVWVDGADSQLFCQGVLCPPFVKEIYTTPSEALLDNAAKNLAITWEADQQLATAQATMEKAHSSLAAEKSATPERVRLPLPGTRRPPTLNSTRRKCAGPIMSTVRDHPSVLSGEVPTIGD
ncbi:hypothetical protein BHE74_00030656 [Ensete ventricosum]|nr:hypothetical protein BHE74_00030656 [Ensete ventricosum]